MVDGPRIAAICTSALDDGTQAQSLARSSDGVTFAKEASNPVLDHASTGFRDPEVFRHHDHWVLLLSVDGPDGPDVVYRVGSFDGVHLLGWMADPDDAGSTPTAPWRGAMTLPRELSLRTVDGAPTLRQRVRQEVSGRLVHEVGELPATDGVVVCRFSGDASWEFSAGDDVMRVAVEGHELVVDRRTSGLVDFHPSFPRVTRSPLPLGTGGLEVHLDRCSVEVFAGGTSSTDLVFPTEPYRTVTGTAGFHVLAPTPQEEAP